MRALYLGAYKERFKIIDEEIDIGVSVLELCFGDLYLYENYLSEKKVDYLGFDISPAFINYAKKRGVNVVNADVKKVTFPVVDVVIMQSSLYQFFGQADALLEKMLKATKKKLIISEPVRSLAQSQNKIVSLLAKRMVNAGQGHNKFRYENSTLKALFEQFVVNFSSEIKKITYKAIKGGRELVVIIEK